MEPTALAPATPLGTSSLQLPAGMRDWMPGEASALVALARRVLGSFELMGYERVTLPVFEYASVLERGLGALEPSEVVRFVEPESGEVVALRPDMTPQIARLVATRLRDALSPARLYYEGSVLRRRRERARKQRQVPQVGVELIGAGGAEADLEVLSVATRGIHAAGLERFTLDLSHAQIPVALMAEAAPEARAELLDALGKKDGEQLVRAAERSGLRGATLTALAALPELHGAEDVWPRARRLLAATPAAPAMEELQRLWDAARELSLAPTVLVDLGEVWDVGYYTGAVFRLFAPGPGEAIGSGGRYDGLLGRFGAPRPAAGFALDLEHLRWSLETTGDAPPRAARISVHGAPEAAAVVVAGLRAAGMVAARAPEQEPLAHARQWRYTHLVELEAPALKDVSSDAAGSPLPREPERLIEAVLERASRALKG